MLILLSLRIRGTLELTRTLLRRMHDLAAELLGVIKAWRQVKSLAYASNSLIVNIAYSAVLVPRLARQLDIPSEADSLAMIDGIALILDEIAASRYGA